MRQLLAIGLLIALTGCQTVHTTTIGGQLHGDDKEMPIAMWFAPTLVDQNGKPVGPSVAEKISAVFKDNGLRATVDEKGVAVPDDETKRAYIALMTDRRLADLGISVIFLSEAGEANRTANGFEITNLRRMPSTNPTPNGDR